MDYRKAHVISLIIMFAGLVVAVILIRSSVSWPVFVIIIAGIIIRIVFCRCPNCGNVLYRNLPKFCPNCGEKLEPDSYDDNNY